MVLMDDDSAHRKAQSTEINSLHPIFANCFNLSPCVRSIFRAVLGSEEKTQRAKCDMISLSFQHQLLKTSLGIRPFSETFARVSISFPDEATSTTVLYSNDLYVKTE
jgi:hypothetical protein